MSERENLLYGARKYKNLLPAHKTSLPPDTALITSCSD